MVKNNIWVINLGASHFSLSSFSVKGSLKIEQYHTFSLEKELKDEWQWINAVADSFSNALENGLGIPRKSEAKIILPAHLLLTKSIKVPWVESSRRKQVIAFEAQQNIPYPISEVEWGSYVVADDGVETEVLITAVKSDLIKLLCKKITLLGIEVTGVSASPVLSYNAYRFNYPDLTEDSLIIDMGSRSSNLIFANQNTFFIRSLNLGGDTLTKKIADSLKVSITKAEDLKINYQLDLINKSDHNHSLLENTEQQFMERFCQEINRSIVTYRQQTKKSNPSTIFLTGKASLIPELDAFINSKIGVKVAFFDGFKNVLLGNNFKKTRDQFQLTEVVGEACKQFLDNPVGIDLTPKSLIAEKQFSKKQPYLYISAILLAISLIPAILQLRKSSLHLEQLVQEEQSKLTDLQSISNKIATNMEKGNRLKNRLQSFESLVNTKFNWINFFSDLQKSMLEIEDVWLDDLYLSRSSTPAKSTLIKETFGAFETDPQLLEKEILLENEYKVIIKGRLLIRQSQNADSTTLTEGINTRINDLVIGITQSSFVKNHQDLKIDFSPIRAGLKLVPFGVTLNINSEKPL